MLYHFDLYFEQLLKFWVRGLCFHFNTIRKSYGLTIHNFLIENDFFSFPTNDFVAFVLATKFCPLLLCARVSECFALQQVDVNVSWQKGRKINFNYLKICPLAQSVVLGWKVCSILLSQQFLSLEAWLDHGGNSTWRKSSGSCLTSYVFQFKHLHSFDLWTVIFTDSINGF